MFWMKFTFKTYQSILHNIDVMDFQMLFVEEISTLQVSTHCNLSLWLRYIYDNVIALHIAPMSL